jgi:2-oxoglutarate ferredoxin oxidoreductase subunit beta
MVTGIIRSFEDMTFGEREAEQTAKVKANSKFRKTDDLFFSGDIYQVF